MGFFQCSGAQRAKLLAACALLLDEMRALQVSEVLGHGLLRHAERLGEFVDRGRALPQAIQDPPAGGIGERDESEVEFIHNPMVVNIAAKVKPELHPGAGVGVSMTYGRPIFQARLVNGVWGDPGVCIDLKFQRRALLFDIGDVQSLSTRVLLRVSDVFVSHTHMDHFAGFDHLLRVCLGRDTGVRLYGPPNFISQVEHKLAAYTWNLVQNYSVDFIVEAHELRSDGSREETFPLGELKRDVLEFVPGQKVCYVTDVSGDPPNAARIAEFVASADLLFIEAVFLEADAEMAARKAHLTTTQAGTIARVASVRQAEPFHFSARYRGHEEQHRAEFMRAWLNSS